MAKKRTKTVEPPAKCVVDRKRVDLVTPCYGMDLATNHTTNRGIRLAPIINLNNKTSRSIALLGPRKRGDRDLCLNYCPFCGTKLAHTPTARKSSRAG